MEIKSNKQGYCPFCNNNNLSYEVVQFEGDYCFFPWTCKDCNTQGEEYYYMEFTGHNIYNDDGTAQEVGELYE